MKTKLIKNTDSKLYNRGSKNYVADLLSDRDKNIIFTKNDLNNIIYKYDKKEIIFYENKKTKKGVKENQKIIHLKNIENLLMFQTLERRH